MESTSAPLSTPPRAPPQRLHHSSALHYHALDDTKEDARKIDTVFNVDAHDPPCLDIYTSAAVRVADATFIFPQQYLHCNKGRDAPAVGEEPSGWLP